MLPEAVCCDLLMQWQLGGQGHGVSSGVAVQQSLTTGTTGHKLPYGSGCGCCGADCKLARAWSSADLDTVTGSLHLAVLKVVGTCTARPKLVSLPEGARTTQQA